MKSQQPKLRAILLTATLTIAALVVASAQTKPNLSGSWKMNAAKSKFDGDGPSGILAKFEHAEPSLNEALTISGPNGDQTIEMKYTTDGKEASQSLGPMTAQTSAKWDGATLTIDWKAEGMSFQRKLSLSADGKTLTMAVRRSGENGGTVDETVVLEKQ